MYSNGNTVLTDARVDKSWENVKCSDKSGTRKAHSNYGNEQEHYEMPERNPRTRLGAVVEIVAVVPEKVMSDRGRQIDMDSLS